LSPRTAQVKHRKKGLTGDNSHMPKIMKTYGTMIIFGSQAKNLNNNNRFQKFEADNIK
jgi:hypothetical protein